ncbi:agmatine deiminase family protein [Marivirga arenosa]|uniref:Agmatine deiminase family protein n=1 Tax=Marivirga arenosa TaxID=3059076 RepID=A0AA49GH46_9BACT|nr:agmatine deiminase family protein [Marivirga sp. BKB1-2]WKK81993.2 agmatine deiminase family protein [Marivirga sp. BKB1-2]
MVLDTECNTVYFSEKLKENFPDEFALICEKLAPFEYINIKLLKGTKDEWARDYMPIQTHAKRLLKFRYQPSYEPRSNWTDPTTVIKENNLKCRFSKHNINLDGGNIIKWKDKVIISDRVETENHIYKDDPDLLYQRIADDLQTEVLKIKAHEEKDDMTGHIDGMMRFVDGNTLIGNDLNQEYKAIKNSIENLCEKNNFKYINMPFFTDHENHYSAIGVYVNFLEIADVILFPIFNHPKQKNEQALQTIHDAFPKRNIISINIDAIGKHGGLMNCISWCLKE